MSRETDKSIAEWLGWTLVDEQHLGCSRWKTPTIEIWVDDWNPQECDQDAITLLPALVERGYHVELWDADTQWSCRISSWDRTKEIACCDSDTIASAIASSITALIEREQK